MTSFDGANALELLIRLEALGVSLRADQDKLLYRPVSVVSPDLRAAMAAHKAEILEWLTWPVETAARAARRPAVGEFVSTPKGRGQVLAVLPEFVSVRLLDRQEPYLSFLPCEIVSTHNPGNLDDACVH
jgi:TubC N-terminal docking domain